MSDPTLQPFSYDERRRRGFCTCPQKIDAGPTLEPCLVHPDDEEPPETERIARGLLFFDDRRNRFVTWPDAVEGMRQRRYVGVINDDIVQFTWLMLIRLLESLRDPLGVPAPEMSPALVDELIAWSETTLAEDNRRWLLTFARGGGSMALCSLFRDVARRVLA